MRLGPVLLAALALGGCASSKECPAGFALPATPAWHAAITSEDRNRIRDWRRAWIEALDQARAAGHGEQIEGEGALLDPDAAIAWTPPPEGEYDCRVIKAGTRGGNGLAYVAYPNFACRISAEDGRLRFRKLSGSQRHHGTLYPDENRMIFLGTLQLGDEERVVQYGTIRDRNLAGIVTRIGERRWRMALPYPHFESTLDIIELVPKEAR